MKIRSIFALPNAGNHFGPVVQSVRMPACHAGGRGFESRPDRIKAPKAQLLELFAFPEHRACSDANGEAKSPSAAREL